MPQSRFRVLQFGSSVALDYCGKLFGDFGADLLLLQGETIPRDESPRITTAISWFGEHGPYAGYAATEATVPKPRRAQSNQ